MHDQENDDLRMMMMITMMMDDDDDDDDDCCIGCGVVAILGFSLPDVCKVTNKSTCNIVPLPKSICNKSGQLASAKDHLLHYKPDKPL